jgi:AraC-like DNA-binding protein
MGLAPLCRRLQINPLTLLRQEQLPSTVLRSPELLISYESFAHLLNLGAQSANYPLFGIALAAYQGLNTFGPLGSIATGYDTIQNSLEAMQRHFHFHAQGVAIDLRVEGREASLVIDFNLDTDMPLEQLCELSILLAYNVLREMAPTGMAGASLRLAHEAQAPIAEYRKHTPLPIRFGQADNAIVFPCAILRQRPEPPSAEIRQSLESLLWTSATAPEKPLQHTVTALIHELIPTGEATLAAIASLMHTHVRTLQRELSAESCDFRTLLDAARFQIARHALERGESITDLALNLGYSELSAFSRAFKRWAGVSPQHWRPDQAFGYPGRRSAHPLSQTIKPATQTIRNTGATRPKMRASGLSRPSSAQRAARDVMQHH